MTQGPRQQDRKAQRVKAKEVMVRATFKLSCGKGEWGTGFFIAPDLALTAWHNVRDPNRQEYDAYFGKIKLRFVKVPGWESSETDVAALRLVQPPADYEVGPLQARRLDPTASRDQRIAFFEGRPVAVYGFPFASKGQVEADFYGQVDAQAPIVNHDEKSEEGYGDKIKSDAARFRIIANAQAPNVPGASGSPVFDMDEWCVLGVLVSCSPNGGQLFATDLRSWLEDLGERGSDVTKLEQIIKLFPGPPPPPPPPPAPRTKWLIILACVLVFAWILYAPGHPSVLGGRDIQPPNGGWEPNEPPSSHPSTPPIPTRLSILGLTLLRLPSSSPVGESVLQQVWRRTSFEDRFSESDKLRVLIER